MEQLRLHNWDVVVLDVQMPRVSGYVAARVLKDDWQTADVPVLFLTSLNAASDRYWGARAGGEFVAVPLPPRVPRPRRGDAARAPPSSRATRS